MKKKQKEIYLHDIFICKNDNSQMELKKNCLGEFSNLKCPTCYMEYLVIDNIVLTSRKLMDEQDKKLQKKIRKDVNRNA